MAQAMPPSYYGPAPSRPQTNYAVTALLIIVLIVVGLLAYPLVQRAFSSQTVSETTEETRTWWSELSFNPIKWYEDYVKRQLDENIIVGKTEQTAGKPFGVLAEELKSVSQQYESGEPVTVFTTLNALSLAKEKIDVTLDCYGSKAEDGKGDLIPGSRLEVIGKQTYNVDCTFPKLSSGSHVITLLIDFDFTTFSYLPTFFASSDLLRTLARDNKNFFTEYAKGYSSNQQSVSTAGPINLGMGIGEQPIALAVDQTDRIYTLGLTVYNKWNGHVKQVKDLTIISPKGFTIHPTRAVSGASGPAEKITCSQLPQTSQAGCSDDLQNIYKIPIKAEKIKDYKNYRAYFVAQSPQTVLGNAPYVQTTFRSLVSYVYEFEKKKTVTVKAPEQKTTSSPGVTA